MKKLSLITFLLFSIIIGCNNSSGTNDIETKDKSDNSKIQSGTHTIEESIENKAIKDKDPTEMVEAPDKSSVNIITKPIYLTKDKFLRNVWDFESNPQAWQYKGELPCIIDFYADWCGPCRRVAPIMEQFAKEYKGKIIIYKVDTDKQKELAAIFKIQSIPSVLFVPKNGQPQMTQGALPKTEFVKIIDKVIFQK